MLLGDDIAIVAGTRKELISVTQSFRGGLEMTKNLEMKYMEPKPYKI